MWTKKSLIGALLAIQLTIASGQGYGNIEDDSAAQKPIPPSQQISSLPQYESDAALSSDGYGAPPNSNLQSNPNPQSADQSQTQDYWWLNQNAFQKPAGHPGVEQIGQTAPAQPPQGNRSPNAYNPSSPPQNSYQQPPPQQPKPQPAPFKPQNNNNPYQQNSPPPSPSSAGFGWQPQPVGQDPATSQPSGFNAPPPSNNFGQPNNALAQVPFECMLLNKADCHKGGFPPQANNFQPQVPSEPFNKPNGGYNAPAKPEQTYRPPQQQPQIPQPPQQPFQQPSSPQSPPSGYYQPPQAQKPQLPNPYENRPQNLPSNQNNQPQFQPDSLPASSFQTDPVPNNYQPYQPQVPPPAPQQQYNKPAPPPQQYNKPAPPQQQYNKPAPPQQQQYNKPAPPPTNYSPPQSPSRPFDNQQQFQNNAQGIAPNNQQQQQNYEDQLPYPGCPAAMLCVNENQCNLIGIIEEGLRLSAAEKAHRVALSRCSEPSTGIEGICCRDPNYKDPWPDMQGQGNGGDHQHHHGDKGQGHPQPQSSGQVQSQPSNNFKNPYAGLRRNITTQRQPYKTEFQSCLFGEACVIAYKCQEGFLKGSQDKKPIDQDKGDSTLQKNVKKCKEDIFKNAFVCCKVGTVTRPQGNSHPISNAPTPNTLTIRPTTVVTPSSSPPTKEAIYKNNYLLTNTLAPTPTETDVTESSLITGLGLRFHSQLHTKAAIRSNEDKPNPYTGGSGPAIIPLDLERLHMSDILDNRSNVPTAESAVGLASSAETESAGNLSETSSNSIELLSSASNTQSTNESVVILEVREKITVTNGTQEISPKTTANSSMIPDSQNGTNSTTETYRKVDIHKIPENVPLSEEYSTYPPVGFIFKGNDLYIPDVDIPSQMFLPPSFEYEEKKDEVIEEAVRITEDDLTETTTLSDTSSLG